MTRMRTNGRRFPVFFGFFVRTGAILLLPLLLSALPVRDAACAAPRLRILATTLPGYLMTRHVTQGCGDVRVDMLFPAGMGCPHDYALTPRDMGRLEQADVVVINGLGMEDFLRGRLDGPGRPALIDASLGLEQLPEFGAARASPPGSGNPHIAASPGLAGRMVRAIGDGLAARDPQAARTYLDNARAYAGILDGLAGDLAALSARLSGQRVAGQADVFEYFTREAGLRMVAGIDIHAGSEPSAAGMLRFIADVRRERAEAVLLEPANAGRLGARIREETGVVCLALDPVYTGPAGESAASIPLDYYERIVRRNMDVLDKHLSEKSLGAR
jgi:ABC-type Zn uptake system ZnuABC Zn-binding protein ZnuA